MTIRIPLPVDTLQTDSNAGSLRARWWVAIGSLAVIGVVVAFYKLGDFRTLGSHEVYAAVTAREMLNTGDWIVPRFGGLPRLEKPPLAYWVIAGSATLFGGIDDWTVRFPAAVSALLLAALMGVWATRWYGRAAGIAAAFVQMTSVYTITFARKAEVDMLLCLLTTSAIFLVADQPEQESRRRSFVRWSGMFALLALAWLAKFHYGPTMVLAPAIVYFVVQKRYRGLWNMANPVGLALLAAAVVIWPYLLLKQIPNAWDVWHNQTVGRAVGALGQDPLWFYVPHTLLLTLPWTPLALWSMPASWRAAWMKGPERERYFGIALWKQGDARERFLWVWFLVIFAIVTASANKHMHYIMAALPVFSLWGGRSLAAISERLATGRGLVTKRAAFGMAATSVVIGLGVAVGMTVAWPDLLVPAAAIGALLALGGSAIVWSLRKSHAVAAAYLTAGVFLGCYMGVTGWIMPVIDHRLSTAEFAAEIRRELPADSDIGVYRLSLSSLVYYLDEPLYRVETADAVRARLHERQRLLLVTYETGLPELAALGKPRVVKTMLIREGAVPPKHPPYVLIELSAQPVVAKAVEPSRDAASR